MTAQPPARAGGAVTGRRPDASMTLLNEVIERPLDPGYAAAADARRQGRARTPSIGSRMLNFALALVLGLAGVWAARELRIPTGGVPSASSVLAEELRQRSEVGDELLAENEHLRVEITDRQAQLLGPAGQGLLDEAEMLSVWAGTTAVHGPGIQVTMADSERASRGEPGTEDERVKDIDLQVVVNGLWASGAEAVAINGHRLTGRTAIRTAGDAILVDLQPLVSPYVISVVGDPDELRTEFARTAAAAALNLLAQQYSISSSISTAEDLELPGGPGTALRYVTESS
ncbi:DUF881 domain-containing protein [Ruania albidiflava]|uniref:DUF881 domain-containing protein n=1 Tax=Ruania albidiflava TaxID=366586 RepID=UPI0003B7629B|nr:DUF881 domain-containing protein [Ruania albidiflava]